MDRIEQLYEQAVKTKNRIVQANLRLVVSIAKRHVGARDDFFSLVSDGNISLMRRSTNSTTPAGTSSARMPRGL